MPRYACPACNVMFEVAREHVGMTVRCPGCGAPLATGTRIGQSPISTQGPQMGGGSAHAATIGQSPMGQVGQRGQFGQPAMPPTGPAFGQTPPGQDPYSYPPVSPPGQYPYGGYPMYSTPQPAAPNPAGLWAFLLSLAGVAVLTVSMWIGLDVAADTAFIDAMDAQMRLVRHMPGWMVAAVYLGTLISLAALVLGIYALTRPRRRRGLAIAGIVISCLWLLQYASVLMVRRGM